MQLIYTYKKNMHKCTSIESSITKTTRNILLTSNLFELYYSQLRAPPWLFLRSVPARTINRICFIDDSINISIATMTLQTTCCHRIHQLIAIEDSQLPPYLHDHIRLTPLLEIVTLPHLLEKQKRPSIIPIELSQSQRILIGIHLQ